MKTTFRLSGFNKFTGSILLGMFFFTYIAQSYALPEQPANIQQTVSSTPAQQQEKTTTSTYARKSILINESRDISAFFIIGIAINILMAITFIWWFSKEWRKQKK